MPKNIILIYILHLYIVTNYIYIFLIKKKLNISFSMTPIMQQIQYHII